MQENRYWRVQGHTLEKHKKEITERVEQMHEDEVPVIEYTEIDGNRKFLDWIEKNTG
ncbi:MAG: divalent cation tolerance protein CutA [Candidatus Nanohaloarchaea archaeon]